MRKSMKYVLSAITGAAAALIITAASQPDGFRMGRSMEILVNMLRDINLFYVDEVDPDVLLSDAAAGMVAHLDPYTDYIPEKDMAAFQLMTTGRYGGIGSAIRQNNSGIIFAEPYKDAPADKAGIVAGDQIIEVSGRSAAGMSVDSISSMLRGEPGTKIHLRVRKFYTGDTVSLDIKREIIGIPGIPYYGMVNDTTGYILHSEFTEDVSNDMRNAIMKLKAQGAKSLILDYRNNGGGIMQEAVKILSFFVPRGTEVVSMRGRNVSENAAFTTQNDPIDTEIPIVVLINNGTASAAEIVAGALQDLDRGVVMGRRSFGKGLIQSTRPVGYNSYLKITTAKYYLPSGRCIQAVNYAAPQNTVSGRAVQIPDSLITEFATRAGRKVYDGGGVMPDVKLDADYVSSFAYKVFGKGYIHDFVDSFMLKNTDREIIPAEFSLSDDDYAEFEVFMQDKNVGWVSETKRLVEMLKQTAEEERYLQNVSEHIDAIDAQLDDDVQTGLELYRKELTDLIENEIILRRAYGKGVIQHTIKTDTDIRKAVELLQDRQHYRQILASQDTDKK